MKTVLAWSSGKDSAFALYELQKYGKHEVVSLLTTVTKDYDRISMHGVRTSLLEEQTRSLGLPLKMVRISRKCSNGEYERKMKGVLEKYLNSGITVVAFGDIFLEDLRKYRENQLLKMKMKAAFPVWGKDTGALAREFIGRGFKAVITCVDTKTLDRSFCGREYDGQFLADLPQAVDPCGENGEFHSFAYDGPVFKNKIEFRKGKKVLRNKRFCFCDLVPAKAKE